MIRVLVVDDHVMVRKGLVSLLEAYEDLTLAGEAPDGEQAVLLYEHTRPDVVLMDMLMPRMDGIEAIKNIRERYDWLVDRFCGEGGRTDYHVPCLPESCGPIWDNHNICWLDILVEDKAKPLCKPPLSITIPCTDNPRSPKL